jgi:hypothetical protein
MLTKCTKAYSFIHSFIQQYINVEGLRVLFVRSIFQCYMMATPPYPKSGRGGRARQYPDVRVSLQRINEMTSGCSTPEAVTKGVGGLSGMSRGGGINVLGTTTTSSATEATHESSNTLSEYLNAGDLYDSLKGEQLIFLRITLRLCITQLSYYRAVFLKNG